MPFAPGPPPTFSGRDGQQWCIDLTLGVVRAIKTISGLDLIDAMLNGIMLGDVLGAEPGDMAAALWECIAADADRRGVTRDQFVDNADANTLWTGRLALIEAAGRIFPASTIGYWIQSDGIQAVADFYTAAVTAAVAARAKLQTAKE